MRWRRWTMLLCSAALLQAGAQAAAARQTAEAPATQVDSGWIVARLARPAPMRTSFVEVRGSKLLKASLRIAGEYLRPDADTLVRRVRTPYVETTTIISSGAGAGQATIERGGKVRRYSLSRVPELASLQSSFGALLDGDSAALQRDFRLDAQGTRQRWTLTLVPKQAALAERVQRIVLHGRGAELRCIETLPVQGDAQRTLLATAARAVGAATEPARLTALCHGET